MSAHEPALHQARSETDVRKLFSLMVQLRPHLGSADEFVERWKRQVTEGYHLIALYDGVQPRALAGYRLQENLVHGRFLYVDDLVTDAGVRGQGYGERLMTYLRTQAQTLQCGKLVLDTPLSNALGHRFYFRCGLLATSLRFNMPIEI
ncbi:GNAT family N-acetyltransferase [Oxalobacteraceae bacterium OM1]|nr:GNAT family N-acetyltransferase [Oxalobacteraceae bacterium OM1]